LDKGQRLIVNQTKPKEWVAKGKADRGRDWRRGRRASPLAKACFFFISLAYFAAPIYMVSGYPFCFYQHPSIATEQKNR